MPKALARRRSGYEHELELRQHRLIADEPEEEGGTDAGPRPTELLCAALATCTAITIEMYAGRKGWDVGNVEVEVDMEYGSSSVPRSFEVTLRLEKRLSEEQADRLVEIAGKCPVHRALRHETEVSIEDRVELV